MAELRSNFAHLAEHDAQLLRIGLLAERYFPDDPNTSLLKLRQLADLLAQFLASRLGVCTYADETTAALLRRLQDRGLLPREIAQLFTEIRCAGNAADHRMTVDHATALAALKIAWQLSVWFHRTLNDPEFQSGPFLPPAAQFSAVTDETASRERMVQDAEQAQAAVEQQLRNPQAVPADQLPRWIEAAHAAAAAVHLDEAETRRLVDEQLRQAGWIVDSATLRYAAGARPEKGRNLAIAEWPTASGPADYVLYVGLVPVAAVEAKRRNTDVSGALQQARRYSRDFIPPGGVAAPLPEFDGGYRLPFVFSANGRPYLRQLATKSGVWFCDLRRPDNLAHALDGWYTPEGLMALLKRDEPRAHEQLRNAPFAYGFALRDYQQAAIRAAEAGIGQGRRELLLAMATGTGKTKTCIALIYRLLKAQRFRRVLFLVDRSALGEQAGNAFKDTRMESLQTFADIFGIQELDQPAPDTDTAVHIATVQGMVQRVLYPPEDGLPPPVDRYDCIVVDECHRGYLLDRELSDTELGFRSSDDYISKYRRVLDYFDAVKIGLTATPALHTTQIFGAPIYTYGYREAVIDGFLIDHEPPLQISTELSAAGIRWKVGERVQVYDPRSQQIDLFTTPDEIRLDIEDFNRKVVTEAFNRAICHFLARELDPSSRQKTLIFCVTDAHADLVVHLLKQAFRAQYGEVDDDAVIKITGAADQPLQLIRRYRNERQPNVAVTVDLLTTGIDVPEICNLVFLRRVNSRILFEQMLGRATRPCDAIGKETFRIFDAVRLYEALQPWTDMRPVVVDPAASFGQLAAELATVTAEAERALVRDQFVAKLQRRKRSFSETDARDFETAAGMGPDEFIRRLRTLPLAAVAAWFIANPGLAEILDRKSTGQSGPVFISDHPDRLLSTEHGYGRSTRPEDYLKEFAEFIAKRGNALPALLTVLTRPRELTRKQLRELALELDRAGFSEANLATAWREMTNQDIAARLIGYIRQAALGDPLQPWERRVDQALQKILASRSWTTPQRQWLQRIAAQTKANLIVDRAALDDPDLVFRREGGGFQRLDKLFDGELAQVLDQFHDQLWQQPAA